MKDYVKPMMESEVFAANEYIAACFQLACHRGSYGNSYPDSNWDGPERGGVSHSTIGTPTQINFPKSQKDDTVNA